MLPKRIFLLVVIFFALTIAPAAAETNTEHLTQPLNTTRTSTTSTYLRPKINTTREYPKEKVTSRNAILKEKIQTEKEDEREKLLKQEELRASLSATLKEKLHTFHDQTKANRVEDINTRLSSANQKATTDMMHHLGEFTPILGKVEVYVTAATDKDTTNAKAAIAKAKTAIENAKAAIDTQSQNTYIVDVSSESTAKEDVITTYEQLKTDLKNTQDEVQAAKQAVTDAIQAARIALGGSK